MKKDVYKCGKCGYEIEVCDVSSLNKSKFHFNNCEGKEYQDHLFNIRKIKGIRLELNEFEIAHDLFWGN